MASGGSDNCRLGDIFSDGWWTQSCADLCLVPSRRRAGCPSRIGTGATAANASACGYRKTHSIVADTSGGILRRDRAGARIPECGLAHPVLAAEPRCWPAFLRELIAEYPRLSRWNHFAADTRFFSHLS